jgi:hypothetical protein
MPLHELFGGYRGAVPGAMQVGRFQIVAQQKPESNAPDLLMLDTATGVSWYYDKVEWLPGWKPIPMIVVDR